MMITNWRQDCELHDKYLKPNATLSINVGNLDRDDANFFSPSYCCLQIGIKGKSGYLSKWSSPLVVNNVPGSPNKLTRGSGAIVVFSKPRWAASRLARAFHFRNLHIPSRQVNQACQAAFTGGIFFIVTLGIVQRAS